MNPVECVGPGHGLHTVTLMTGQQSTICLTDSGSGCSLIGEFLAKNDIGQKRKRQCDRGP